MGGCLVLSTLGTSSRLNPVCVRIMPNNEPPPMISLADMEDLKGWLSTYRTSPLAAVATNQFNLASLCRWAASSSSNARRCSAAGARSLASGSSRERSSYRSTCFSRIFTAWAAGLPRINSAGGRLGSFVFGFDFIWFVWLRVLPLELPGEL